MPSKGDGLGDGAGDGQAEAELYVYYRVPREAAAQALAEVRAAHAAVRQIFPSIASRCLQRLGNRDEMPTWMEIHQQPGGLDASTVADICAMLEPWPSARAGARHVEVFATLPASGAPECA